MASADWQLAYERALALATTQAGFLGRASHELRSPINHIISLHQLILEGLCEDPDEEKLFLAQAFEATQKVLKNLDVLIAVSKLEIGRTEPILLPLSLQHVVAEVGQLTEMVVKNRNGRLTIVPTAEAVLVESDRDWLQQALVLLVEAAIAADSQRLQFQWQVLDETTVLLEVQTDSPLENWQAIDPAPSPNGADTEADPKQLRTTQLAPAFSLQIAERIVSMLGGRVKAMPSTVFEPQNQAFHIFLPQSEDIG